MLPAPQPFYFGSPGEGLFGWLHRPAELIGGSGLGLVVCNPFGFEEVCAHRSLMHLATRAAGAGVPALRFDYAGGGNSEGDEFAPQRLESWVRSVHCAIDALKQASGVTRVCLLGIRLGATLATLAAVERDDVEGLIAIAPVIRGRAYVRELTVLGQAGAAALPAPTREGLLESGGFLLTHETSVSLGNIDLRMLARRPAAHVVIVERDDVPVATNWAPVLERFGAAVQQVNWLGYAAMMRDPQRALVPQQIVDGMVACLKGWLPEGPAASIAYQPVGSSSQRVGSLRETAVHIDTGASRLFGILTRQEDAVAQPAVLMLNSGSVHHIGPSRLWLQLSRRWAEHGVTVLRLDLSGIADSPPQPGAEENVVYSGQAVSDVAAALSYLQQHVGATQCHVMGLCSGGYHALKAAIAGHDMAGALVINPLTFYWKEGTRMSDLKDYEVSGLAAKFSSRLFTTTAWKKLLQGKVDVRIVMKVALRRLWNFVYPHALALARACRIPLKDDLARDLAGPAKKGIRLKFVFAKHAPGFELLEMQGGGAIHRLVRRGQATLDFVPDADHTFTRLDARERLVAVLDARILAECKRD